MSNNVRRGVLLVRFVWLIPLVTLGFVGAGLTAYRGMWGLAAIFLIVAVAGLFLLWGAVRLVRSYWDGRPGRSLE